MHYDAGGKSPYHLHGNCEHLYFIMEGEGTVDMPEGRTAVGPGTMVFIPAEDKHRLSASLRQAKLLHLLVKQILE